MAKDLAWHLTFRDNDSGDRRERVREGAVLTIGRSPNADVVVNDASVSRAHFRLTARSDGLFVEDLGSGNGTLIDGSRIGSDRWRPGQALRAGNVLFSIALAVDADVVPIYKAASPGAQGRQAPPFADEPQMLHTEHFSPDAGDKLRVFISYSRIDAALANRIAGELESRDFKVVIDRRDLPFGEEWQRELGDLIRSSDVVMFFITESSISSNMCRWELEQSTKYNKRLLPLAVSPFSIATLPPELARVQILPPEGIFVFERHIVNLVKALNADRGWLKERTRLYDRATEWITRGEPSALLLRGSAIGQAEAWIARRPKAETLPYEIAQLVKKSRRAQLNRRLSSLSAAAVLAAVAAVGITMFVTQSEELSQMHRDKRASEQGRLKAEKEREAARNVARQGLEKSQSVQERDQLLQSLRNAEAALQVKTKVADAARTKLDQVSFASTNTAIKLRGFARHDHFASEGLDLRKIELVGLEACASECQSEARCNVYSYDKWNRMCFLKTGSSVLFFDAQYVTGVARDVSAPPLSTKPIDMQRYRGKAIPEGSYGTRPAQSFEVCEDLCRRQESCVALTFYKTNTQCRLFTDAGEYFGDATADTSVKRQLR